MGYTLSGLNAVLGALDSWANGRMRQAEKAGEVIGPELEQYAKQHRPWTDRTGAARDGLHSKIVVDAREMAVQLHHGVEYGVYLELARAGKYAILVPTLESNREMMRSTLKRFLL